jgi:hypothetical protein
MSFNIPLNKVAAVFVYYNMKSIYQNIIHVTTVLFQFTSEVEFTTGHEHFSYR